MACFGISIIGLFNLGLHWEERHAFVENVTWELQSQLTLSESQMQMIMKINYEFYDAVSNAQKEQTEESILDEEISRLIVDKNKKIMKVLNEDQQREWLKRHLHRSLK